MLAVLAVIWLAGSNQLRVALGPDRPEPDAQRPVAAPERTEWDFGVVNAGRVLRATFPVKNLGNRRLILLETEHSCACVSGSRPEIIVPPGRTADLEALLDTSQVRGGVQMELQYTTSDPCLPRLTLTVLADVRPRLSQGDGLSSPEF